MASQKRSRDDDSVNKIIMNMNVYDYLVFRMHYLLK